MRAERVKQVRSLQAKGYSAPEVAQTIGLSYNYVRALINDPLGEKDKARKRRYSGVCEICGAPTSGSNGIKAAPTKCQNCYVPKRFWTKERIIAKIQEWNQIHGQPPYASDWFKYKQEAGAPRYWPTPTTVMERFGLWANAVEEAGFPRPYVGGYYRDEEWRKNATARLRQFNLDHSRSSRMRIDRDRVLALIQRGFTDVEVAEQVGCSYQRIGQIRRGDLGLVRRRGGGNQSRLLDSLVIEQLASQARS